MEKCKRIWYPKFTPGTALCRVFFGKNLKRSGCSMVKERVLTKGDQEILKSYCASIEGLAAYLGSSYEITLHSLESLDHSVIKIMNGFHTGRSEGSPITDLALQMLQKLEENDGESDYQVYFCRNSRNEPMKSTTVAIRGDKGRIIGLLCINMYLATPIMDYVSSMLPPEKTAFTSEHFAENSSAAITQKVERARTMVMGNPAILPSVRNKEIIRQLHDWHVFELKNAIDQVAGDLGISRHTVYFHLRNFSKGE